MQRAYYGDEISKFLQQDSDEIIGQLSKNHSFMNLHELQINAWQAQIQILKKELKGFCGKFILSCHS